MKKLLTQWDTEEENRKIHECDWWKTSQPWRETGEENQTIDMMKNFPTQTGDGGGKPNNRFDEDNFILLADGIRAMQEGGELHLI